MAYLFLGVQSRALVSARLSVEVEESCGAGEQQGDRVSEAQLQ